MTDLIQVLADFHTAQFSHLLPSLDKALITTNDLLTLDAIDIAKRAQLPPVEVAKLADAILRALHKDLDVQDSNSGKVDGNDEVDKEIVPNQWRTISTLDSTLDATLGGGIPTGYVTEITGERYAAGTMVNLEQH
jgi:DNA repair protein RAD57